MNRSGKVVGGDQEFIDPLGTLQHTPIAVTQKAHLVVGLGRQRLVCDK
jgi:hypothetical protein